MCPDLAAFTAAAEAAHVYTVNSRAERVVTLYASAGADPALDPLDDTPKTVRIQGTIELNADATKQPTSRRR